MLPGFFRHESDAENTEEFNKIAERLDTNGNRLYRGGVKFNGNQNRRSFEKNDVAIAKRRLVEFSAKAERLEGEENRNIRFSR